MMNIHVHAEIIVLYDLYLCIMLTISENFAKALLKPFLENCVRYAYRIVYISIARVAPHRQVGVTENQRMACI